MNTNPPIPGHGLLFEGAPHDDYGARIFRPYGGVSGYGRARCQCGAMSDELASSYKRKAWHREHKAQIRTEVTP